jgi:hypothetical protein
MWQYGGRALLGYTPPQLLRVFKNTAERGLFVPLPHPAEDRLYRALSVLLPRRRFRLFPNDAALREALAAANFPAGVFDPAVDMGKKAPKTVPTLWRPWLMDPAVLDSPTPETASLLIPVLPLPFPGAPAVLALDPALEAPFPPAPPLSPVILAAAAQSVHRLLAAPGRPSFAGLDRVLTGNSSWKRTGIYLNYNPPGTRGMPDYQTVFSRFLEGGFLLPPLREEPVILPGELSAGEEVKLAALVSATV